ncbi:MAG: GGDEF domain-containing protein [Lachnospiraceae bacterium]|nr:GGDEF domain-containing protein [Lachnospiraceae bacterium]
MSDKGRKKVNTAFSQANLKRCLYASVVSVAVFPLILLLTLIAPAAVEAYRIPGTFFSIISAAFAFLFYFVKKQKAKRYYDGIVWAYLLYVQLFCTYFAQQSLMFYYGSVLLTAVLVYLPLGQYVILALGQLVCYAGVLIKSGNGQVAVSQILLLVAVHLLAFWVSRDLYTLKRDLAAVEKKLRREIKESEQDALTGLKNRKGLERHAGEVWEVCHARQETVAVLAIELDWFKEYNDQMGHAQGDVCLRRIARLIENTVAGYGVTARTAGAGFLVFVKGLSLPDVCDLAEKIRCRVENLGIPRIMGTNQILTVSIGLDIRYASGDVTFGGLCGRADMQLQKAKQEGRNCIRSSQGNKEQQFRIS